MEKGKEETRLSLEISWGVALEEVVRRKRRSRKRRRRRSRGKTQIAISNVAIFVTNVYYWNLFSHRKLNRRSA